MANLQNPYAYEQFSMVADAPADVRADFIAKTYLHLTGAIVAFAALVAVFINSPVLPAMMNLLVGTQYGALILMGGFIAVSYVANSWAQSATSPGTQYAGLGLYVVAEALIFTPLIAIAERMGGNILTTAAAATLLLFAAMTVVVFFTRYNFSFMGPALAIGAIAAMVIIVCAVIFQQPLGPIFTVAMIALACGYILYDTSNVLHVYRPGQHVAAALALFASVALLFWYVLRLVMSRRD